MFSLINLVLSVFILIRLLRYDKFYMITYDMHVREVDHVNGKTKKNNRKFTD